MSGREHGGIVHLLSHLLPFGHAHESHEGVDEALEASEEGIRALKISLVGLMLTALLQLLVVVFSGSVALLADTIHNFGDSLTSLPLWLAFALGKKAADRAHTYGYGRAEDLAGVAIVAVIFFSACVAAYESIERLIHGSEVSNVGWVALAAVIGFLGNELVAQFRIGVGKKIGSAAMVADGQHARVDGFTSLAVLVGAGGVWLGYPVVDPIVGILITIAILFIVRDSALSMWRRMMDAIEPEIPETIGRVCGRVPGVEGVESVRARWVGHRVHSEVRVLLPPAMTLEEAREVERRLREAIREAMPKLGRLVVEIAPARRR
ncbi:cation diffusion facilitator family transporter [Rubrobacter naiadicus]|uniref:cation diffusion facilitator family transporter n=1 Tax=Rubrobacter naiadicus TaxID=1392641 RepID=UPI0023618F21|nr:cation diffusion facilitator family transporter [Rubrobacter naiadicus]